MKLITKENCLDMVNESRNRFSGDVDTQAKSWEVVHRLCTQLGMTYNDHNVTGIERVVGFILELHDQASTPHP